MNINFHIQFRTEWGQTMCMLLDSQQSHMEPLLVRMDCSLSGSWSAEVNRSVVDSILSYKYAVIDQSDKVVRTEPGLKHILDLSDLKTQYVEVFDFWQLPVGDRAFASVAFTKCFLQRNINSSLSSEGNLEIRLYAPQLAPWQKIAVCGNQTVLGNWNTEEKQIMNDAGFPWHVIRLNTADLSFPLEYKFLLVDDTLEVDMQWESGANHSIENVQQTAGYAISLHHAQFANAYKWKGAGVALPVFSLRSADSMGIGEFPDLKLLVDWAYLTGQSVIQTLPVNDTTHTHTNSDSYPYNAVSVYALHPAYLRVDNLGELKDETQKAYFETQRQLLNALPTVAYKEVMALKWNYFRELFKQEFTNVTKDTEYHDFINDNREWLIPYAVFCHLRDKYATADFSKWPECSVYDEKAVYLLFEREKNQQDSVSLHVFLQYHLHKQLSEVHNYARSKGIALKGDIPIGVSRYSVDAWQNPGLFNLNLQTGAPPDDFSVTGQNWGFPTYNWETMACDNYAWWTNRFRKMATYFDAYRIDHILGFFRIWGIPSDAVWGLTGSFQPAMPFTQDELMQLIPGWDTDRFTRPYVTAERFVALFGDSCKDVALCFFDEQENGRFAFRDTFDSQRKIVSAYNEIYSYWGKKTEQLLSGLFQLHCEVLFVKDSQQPDCYHPRIALQQTDSFAALPETTRHILNELHTNFFYQRHTDFWKQQALTKLPVLISATDMLVCGEDLGMIPDSVPEVMHALEILSLEIQRMPKKPGIEFALPSDAPYLSVCTTSTHDMNPIRAWWLEDATLMQRYYNEVLHCEGLAPEQCDASVAHMIIDQHLNSEAMLVVLPWQDWMALEPPLCVSDALSERINVPSNPDNYWCYRMHVQLEDLMHCDDLNKKITDLIHHNNRTPVSEVGFWKIK